MRRLVVALVVALGTACSSDGSKAAPKGDAKVAEAKPAPGTPRERAERDLLVVDAALKHHELVLADLRAKAATADEIAKEQQTVELLKDILKQKERALERVSGPQ